MFDLSIGKLLILAVFALVIFGPNELPKIAAQAGRALRDLRQIAEGAKADLKDGLGPEFADFDFNDLNPRHFVQKHLLDDMNAEPGSNARRPAAGAVAARGVAAAGGSANGSVNGSTAANGLGTANGSSADHAASPPGRLPEGERPPFDLDAT